MEEMVDSLVIDTAFWSGKKVLITGHTGFKGGWLSIWLEMLGAQVCGYALKPDGDDFLFNKASIQDRIESHFGNIMALNHFKAIVNDFQPEIVFHLAAQPLVRYSYDNPVETFQTNIIGTVNVLEAAKDCESVKSVVIVTSDKCYENKEWQQGYREFDPMGGHDPYSASKGCAELVVASYRNSFFSGSQSRVGLATARAGNVIGGGDYADDRLIPDFVRAIRAESTLLVRSPNAVRPWQHVLEPLAGYMRLAQVLFELPNEYARGWNFGPEVSDAASVESVLNRFKAHWGDAANWTLESDQVNPHEANYLRLDSSLANTVLGWHPRWNLEKAVQMTSDWYRREQKGEDAYSICREQIDQYRALGQ